MIHEALRKLNWSNGYAADVLGVSERKVRRWRAADARATGAPLPVQPEPEPPADALTELLGEDSHGQAAPVARPMILPTSTREVRPPPQSVTEMLALLLEREEAADALLNEYEADEPASNDNLREHETDRRLRWLRNWLQMARA